MFEELAQLLLFVVRPILHADSSLCCTDVLERFTYLQRSDSLLPPGNAAGFPV